jgi:3-dehydroquinate synthase
VIEIEAVEKNKTIAYTEGLIARLREAGARRGTPVIAIGGGIVQDLATLATSLYMRGLEWVYAPTTMMAMVDSCVGGKSSLNVGPFKNLAGNFHPPQRIAIDPTLIATLPAEAVAGGLCEAAKICFCRGGGALERYLDLHADLGPGGVGAAPLIHHVLDSKRWFVERDEFDRAERRLLNLGHTFAHAIEPAAGFSIPHGVAVGVGVLCAGRLARATGHGGSAAQQRLESHLGQLLADVPGLRAGLESIDREAFERAFRADKKHRDGELRLILPLADGTAAEVSLPANRASLLAVRHALEETAASLGA